LGSAHYVDGLVSPPSRTENVSVSRDFSHRIDSYLRGRKVRSWQRPISFVAPSRWLAEYALQSSLVSEENVSVIPNTINTSVWTPIDKKVARSILHLPVDAPLVLFGAVGGVQDPRKGYDLLDAAIGSLKSKIDDLQTLVFGQMSPTMSMMKSGNTHYMGRLQDDISLRLLYSAADVMVIPSRMDNLPNTGLEAHACGTPVVAFRVGGLPDIVSHEETGYLACPFEIDDLAYGISWVLSQPGRSEKVRLSARERAVSLWSNEVVAPQYQALYTSVIKGSGNFR
jgi:glycosyltransferase involved in cell wall biosynthesis